MGFGLFTALSKTSFVSLRIWSLSVSATVTQHTTLRTPSTLPLGVPVIAHTVRCIPNPIQRPQVVCGDCSRFRRLTTKYLQTPFLPIHTKFMQQDFTCLQYGSFRLITVQSTWYCEMQIHF